MDAELPSRIELDGGQVNGWGCLIELHIWPDGATIENVVVSQGDRQVSCMGPRVLFVSQDAAVAHSYLIADSLTGGDEPRGEIAGVREYLTL